MSTPPAFTPLGHAWLGAPPSWVLPAVLLGAALWWLGLAGERGLWRRGRGAARWARIAAWTLAVAALAGLALEPRGARSRDAGAAVLLTAGAPASVQAAARPVFAVDGLRREGATDFVDARALWRDRPGLAAVTVRGYGLDAFDWEGFDGTVDASPLPLPPGITRAAWNRRLALGEALRVEGLAMLAPAPREARLVLEGPAGVEDTTQLRPGEAPFALTARPRATGPVEYALRAVDAAGTVLFEETIDAVVEAPTLPAVLVLESAPRWETRFLKDWLTSAGARFGVRSTISKDRRRTESPAVPRGTPGAALDAAALASFDVVVADPAALAALSGTERAALAGAVESGLGLLVALPRGVAPGAAFAPAPAVAAIRDLELLAARPTWSGAPALPPLDVEARELEGCPPCRTLIADAGGRALAMAREQGRGVVAWSVLHDTERYVLEGNAAAHRAVWSRLLSSTARPADLGRGRWLPPAGPVLVDRPLELTLLAAPDPAPSAELEDGDAAPQPLALRQEALDRGRFHATLWPRRSGWQTVRADTGAGLAFAAAPPERWAAWRAAERARATAARAARGPAPAVGGGAGGRAPLPRWPFYALAVAGLAWLWIDERLRG